MKKIEIVMIILVIATLAYICIPQFIEIFGG